MVSDERDERDEGGESACYAAQFEELLFGETDDPDRDPEPPDEVSSDSRP
jgi:hypothetical protein